MTTEKPPGLTDDFALQRTRWRGQANSIPSLLGGKAVRVELTLELVRLIGDGHALDLNEKPVLSFKPKELQPSQGGASPRPDIATWRDYYGFLRGLRVAEKVRGGLQLTAAGIQLSSDPTPERLAHIFADRFRLFAESLAEISKEAHTVDEVHWRISSTYSTAWQNNASTRTRMDWQAALGLIEQIGERRWKITPSGLELLADSILVTPGSLAQTQEDDLEIPDPPVEIAALLTELSTGAKSHDSRSTYNIWVPSPPSDPNKVENLRTVINATLDRINRQDLFNFICDTFGLMKSSVESMFPFMRAAGLLKEVGKGIYEATPAAKAWIESEDDMNFIRILHANMRFVGEMIRSVENDVTRRDMYSEAALFGLNKEKCRWIASFLLDTGLIEESRYASLRATARGLTLLRSLPLATPAAQPSEQESTDVEAAASGEVTKVGIRDDLVRLARTPHIAGQLAGSAFELAICDAFAAMGFDARVLSGPGDSDVLVQWQNADRTRQTAIVEAKARSNGQVTHTDISDVAIETHKGLHGASFVAIIGPSFAGDTIKNMAVQKKWALLEAERLGTVAESAVTLGLRPSEISQLFLSIGGDSDIDSLLASRGRDLNIVSFVLAKLKEEEQETGEALSARDISRDGRRTNLAPTADEIIFALETLSHSPVDAIQLVNEAVDPKFSTYVLSDATAASNRLHALAKAMENGISNDPSRPASR